MTLHLLLAGWLSLLLAPLPDPGKEVPLPPKGGELAPEAAARPSLELPASSRAAKVSWRPGKYALASLTLPETIPLEKFDMWQPGPNWPAAAVGVVVVTDHALDPARFMAFLVDVKSQRVVAVREGDRVKHLATIGQTQAEVPEHSLGQDGAPPAGKWQLAGSGAVIIVRPPQPPGPNGVPKGLVAKILDAATLAAYAGQWLAEPLPPN
jgi:hypothetical protein